MNTHALSPSQRQALGQLQALTNGGDTDVAISVLTSVDWDVQRAAEVIFDSGPSVPSSISRPSRHITSSVNNREEFEVDDSEQGGLLGGRPHGPGFRRVPPTSSSSLAVLARPFRFILTILAFPFQILRALFRILHIPLPQLPITLSSLTLYYRAPSGIRNDQKMDARSVAERWVRALEEETGAVSLSGARLRAGEASSSGVGASSSTLTARSARQDGEDDGERVLPDFFLGSYEEFVRTCAKENEPKIGCVILVSEEHDDVAEFKRSTLTDPKLVRLMQQNDFLVWGGDIRDRDAWSASQKLQATTYPFVAFIALQPRRGPSSSRGGNATLTILSRHQGPSIPAASAPTSSQTLITHLNEQLLPRVSPFLVRVRNQVAEKETMRLLEAAQRERERALRAEQDRAFEESKRRDRERIEARMAQDLREAEEVKQKEEQAKREKEEQEKAEAARLSWEARRMSWRRWGRKGLVPREPRPSVVEATRGKTMRVGVRMPDGKRGVRFFGEGDSLTALYAYVDTLFIPEGKEFSSDLDPSSPPEGAERGEEGLLMLMQSAGRTGESWWGFKLATSYPRREVVWTAGKRLGDVEGLRGGGQLVVELVDNTKSGSTKGKAVASDIEKQENEYDGYDTEESE